MKLLPDKRPFAIRHWLRGHMPMWVINLGIFGKGDDCEKRGGQHSWYNKGEGWSGCYYCRVVREGRLWEQQDEPPSPPNPNGRT